MSNGCVRRSVELDSSLIRRPLGHLGGLSGLGAAIQIHLMNKRSGPWHCRGWGCQTAVSEGAVRRFPTRLTAKGSADMCMNMRVQELTHKHNHKHKYYFKYKCRCKHKYIYLWVRLDRPPPQWVGSRGRPGLGCSPHRPPQWVGSPPPGWLLGWTGASGEGPESF